MVRPTVLKAEIHRSMRAAFKLAATCKPSDFELTALSSDDETFIFICTPCKFGEQRDNCGSRPAVPFSEPISVSWVALNSFSRTGEDWNYPKAG